MSEPSLRDQMIEAMADAAGDHYEIGEAADAALRVIHTQRDAIVEALKPYISCPDDGVPEDCGHCANERDLAAGVDAALSVIRVRVLKLQDDYALDGAGPLSALADVLALLGEP